MVRILHISDTHCQQDTVRVLDRLAWASKGDTQIIALTGDCVSQENHQVPSKWDKWPQKVKLAVPGNHDDSSTFSLLPTWTHRAPWVYPSDDLFFIGLDLSDKKLRPLSIAEAKSKEFLASVKIGSEAAVVVLSHERITGDLGRCIADLAGPRKLLLLHGHAHPDQGAEWDPDGDFCGRKYYRSNVCSCNSKSKGLAHFIDWANGSFTANPSQSSCKRQFVDL